MATTATSLTASGVMRNRSHILNTTNLHASTSKSTESRLSTRSRGLGTVTTLGPEFDVECSNPTGLAASGNVLGGQHRSIGGRLITISLDHHTASHTRNGLTASHIGNMNESIVEGRIDMSNTED